MLWKLIITIIAGLLPTAAFAQTHGVLPQVSTLPQYYAAATDASIRSLATQICATPTIGGTLNIPGGTIAIASPLPVCSGLVYQGAPMQGAIPSGQTVGA